MKTGTKLTVGFSFTVLAMLLTVLFSLNTSRKMHKEFEALKGDIMPGAITMGQMEGACQQIAHDLMDYMVAAKAAAAEEEEEGVMTGLGGLDKAGRKHLRHETHIGHEEKKTAEELMAKIKKFTLACKEIINLKKQGLSTDELLEKEDESFHPALDSLVEQLREHKAVHMQELAAAEETVHQAHTSGVRVALLVSAFIASLAVAIAFATTRSIVKPLHTLHKGIEVIGQGNLDYKVGTDAKDEIGQLSRAFDQMTDGLKKTTTSIDNLNAANQQLQASEQQLKAANQQLDANNQQLRATEQQLRTLNDNLGERVKELDCLYRLSELATEIDKSVDDIFAEAVNLIPPSWQYPEITCAKIAVENKEYVTDNFKETKWKQTSDIVASGKKIGFVEVYYLEEKPVIYEGPFLREERSLIGALGRQMGGIVERKQAEEALEVSNRNLTLAVSRLEELNLELRDFAHITSHDLKAPLRGVRTLAEWISTDFGDKLDKDGKEKINLLMSRVDRMYGLIDGILEYSRVGQGKEEQVQVNLNELVPEIIDMIAPPENIEITVENELPVVACEEARMMQVFQNLLSNAVKYMDKPKGQIKVGCVEEDGFWKFSVADNGPGIEEKYFERIFRMFQTLSSHDEFESTGIGLTVVKKIVELYGGKIWVESKPGEGSTFFFTLPSQKMGVKSAKLKANIVG